MKDIFKYLTKRTLFLIITIFVIGTLHQCAKAWTWEDIYDLANNVDTSLLNAEQSETRSRILENFNLYTQALTDAGYNMDNFHSFFVRYRNSGGINIQAWSGNTNWYVYPNGTVTSGGSLQGYGIYYSNNNWVVTTGTNSTPNISNSIGLFENADTTFLNTSGLIAQNVYNSIVTTNYNIPANASVPYLLTQGVVGLHYDITQVAYKLVLKGSSGTQDTFNQDLGAVYSETGSGHSVNLQLTTLNTLNGTNNYFIDMYYNGEIIYTSDTFTITKSRTPQARRYYK